ncbi:NAD(P)-binding protein [Backusella circina FSU 941]|nr:NAD(P)-binding protein [Backusella circina FSU 941]
MTGVNKTAFFKPGELIYKDLPIPSPTDDSIIIKNHLAGINFADIYQLNGGLNLTGTDILGLESAGEVVNVGKNITQYKVGDRVLNMAGSTYTNYNTVKSDVFSRIIKLPDYISYEQAIGLGLQALTAYSLVYKDYTVNKGDVFLVQAAAGGVGLILTQLLVKEGGKVIGAVSSQEKVDLVKKYGAEYAINYSTENIAERVKEITNGKGVQVVYDSVGNATFDDSLLSLADFGLLIQYGFASGLIEKVIPHFILPKSLKIHGAVVTAHAKEGDGFNEWMLQLFEDVHSGALKPFLSKEYSFDQILEAFEDMKGRKTVGKLAFRF